MKDYQKPVLEIISFASEAIMDNIENPEGDLGQGSFGDEWG